MTKHKIAIFGGGGFVGSHLASQLSALGHQVTVYSRHPERHRQLQVLPTCQVIYGNPADQDNLKKTLTGHDVVFNLIGILNESGHDGKGFRQVHVTLTKNIITASQSVGVKRFIQMSALGANQAKAPSYYLRTKGEAQVWAHQQNTGQFAVTSFRPSVIFGPEDTFFNRFASLLSICPGIFPLACHESLFAPVYVEDVVRAMVIAIDNKQTIGYSFDMCGPTVYSLKDIVQYVRDLLEIRVKIIGLGPWCSRLQAAIFEYLPGKPFSRDNYFSAQVPSVCTRSFVETFHFRPQSIEAIVPTYLGSHTTQAARDALRQYCRR